MNEGFNPTEADKCSQTTAQPQEQKNLHMYREKNH